jgi:hypothetical protein
MRTSKRRLLAVIITAIVLTIFVPASIPVRAQSGAVITPPASYSNPAWSSLATKYQANLGAVQSGLTSKFASRPYRLLSVGESNVGGIGLWASPLDSPDKRYLAVFARGKLPASSPFPDTDSGRVLQIMDYFGKDTIYIIASQLKTMPEPQIAGAAVILIYGKADINDPAFDQNGEAIAIFIPRSSVMSFANLQMTIQSLFSSSAVMPVFKGGADINELKTSILSP